MLKIKEKDSNGVRVLKQLVQGFLIGALIGGPLGFALGFFSLEDGLKLPVTIIVEMIQYLIYGLIVLLFLVTTVYIFRIRKGIVNYEMSEDDEEQEKLYSLLGRQTSYAQVFVGIALILSFANMLLGYRLLFSNDSAELQFPIYAFVALMVSAGLQMHLLSLSNRVRSRRTTLTPTLKELKNNVLQLDEAELQANYKMSFEIVMTLSGLILPAIYVFLFFMSVIFQKVELTGIFIAVGIHIYIMIMNFKMAKEHYK
ncbi:DUF3169 family protein [Streptococcus sp. S784/96/1]|uniref:DUF3169 family protein n=1 Tax=Streptococcus sp. S784/96/1 TaxID=2653499 RepID=UPI0013873BFD|nr:DUF3169 family protein [Streptococcus sp. S784/96/1]